MTTLARYTELKRQEYAHDLYNQDIAAQNCADEAEALRAKLLADINAALAPLGYTWQDIVKADLV